LRADELPSGRLVVSVSKHLTAVVDGVIHDTHDCSRVEARCVYGYWQRGGPDTTSRYRTERNHESVGVQDTVDTVFSPMLRGWV